MTRKPADQEPSSGGPVHPAAPNHATARHEAPATAHADGPPPAHPDEPAHDPEVIQLAAKVFDLAREGGTDTLAAYVDAGVPPNLSNDRGDTLIMLAAYHGHPQTVAALLERGADPDRPNDRGQTPLAGAVFKGEDAVVDVLLDGGADPAAGTPSAVEAARIFGKDALVARFEGA